MIQRLFLDKEGQKGGGHDTRGQEGLYNTMELLDVLDVIDTEKVEKRV